MVVIRQEWELQAHKTGVNFHPPVRRTIGYSAERVLAGLL